MLWKHRRTFRYLLGQRKYRQAFNHIFVTYFIRGEDCGKGVLDPFWKFFPRLTPFLWDIEVEVTTRCYLRCVMCEHTHWPDKAYLNQDLCLESLKALLDGIPNLKWINLTGEGSCFLNKDFMAMLRFAKARGLYVDLAHDFVYLPLEIAQELVDLSIDRLYLSIDGATKSTYESIRVGADFDKVMENLKMLLRLKRYRHSPLPEICFRMAFFKSNIHEMEALLDLVHSLGLKDLGDEPSINYVGLLDFEEVRDLVAELPKELKIRIEAKARRYGIKLYWSHITHQERIKPPLDYCTFWSEPYIMIGGYVLPCCSVLMSNKRPVLEQLAFGNINEHSLREIWNTPRYQYFRSLVVNSKGKVPRICVGCRSFNTQERERRYGISWG